MNLYSKAVSCHSAAVADANGTEVDCSGAPAVAFQIAGTVTTAVIYFEGTVDGTNYVALRGANVATGAIATSATAAGIWLVDCAGLSHCRARLDWTAGSIDVTARLVAAAPALGMAVGTLAANSGVDIGDVDVTSVPGALQGPGNPTVDSLTSASVTLTANTSDQVLVAGSASHQIWVFGLCLLADTAAGTIAIQDEDNTAITGAIAVSDEGGFVLPLSGNFAMPWFKVATGKALEADTVTCSAAGIVTYAVVNA